LLTDAGYTLGPAGWERAGQPLRLVVAAPVNREPYGTIAARVTDQLRSAGIVAELHEVDPDELFTTLLGPTVDGGPARGGAAEVTAPAGASSAAANQVGITPGVDIVVAPQPAAGNPASQLASWYGCPLVVPAKLAPAPANPASLCDLTLQPVIEAALWDLAVTVPLYQPASLLVTTGQLLNVAPGTPLEGPLDGAARWELRR
jgi:ABC-type transport system substrate-binding protein